MPAKARIAAWLFACFAFQLSQMQVGAHQFRVQFQRAAELLSRQRVLSRLGVQSAQHFSQLAFAPRILDLWRVLLQCRDRSIHLIACQINQDIFAEGVDAFRAQFQHAIERLDCQVVPLGRGCGLSLGPQCVSLVFVRACQLEVAGRLVCRAIGRRCDRDQVLQFDDCLVQLLHAFGHEALQHQSLRGQTVKQLGPVRVSFGDACVVDNLRLTN